MARSIIWTMVLGSSLAGCARLTVVDGDAATPAPMDAGPSPTSDAGPSPTLDAGPPPTPDSGPSPDGGCATDADGDGFLALACGGDDCDDGDPRVHPGAMETCDGVDEDCSGSVDDGSASDWCAGAGAPPSTTGPWACEAGECTFTACVGDFLDCGPGAGCETDGASARASCGACGRMCRYGGCAAATCDEVVAVTAGVATSCALRQSGTLVCWGWNATGLVGDGTLVDRGRPVEVAGLTDVTAVDLDHQFGCAVHSMGRVSCWGAGWPGDGGPFSMTETPVEVPGLTGVVDVSVGQTHVCAVRASGRVACWGNGFSALVGTTDTDDSETPHDVENLADATSVAAGTSHTCALRSTGRVVCWGQDSSGTLGLGHVAGISLVDAEVVGLTSVVEVVAGDFHTCARLASGSVACWGSNEAGALGDGTTTERASPVRVVGLDDAVALAAERYTTCAVRATGSAVCWGRWYDTTPQPLPPMEPVSVTAGHGHTCALLRTGDIVCWGDNHNRQLGDGTTTSSATPVTVLPL